ncbi:nitrate reductase NapE component [Paenibacillus sp. DS2015]
MRIIESNRRQSSNQRKLLTSLFAFLLACIYSLIFVTIIRTYCITVYETTMPGRADFYSVEASLSMEQVLTLFLISNVCILLYSWKRSKLFSIVYMTIIGIAALYSLMYIDTNIINGV